MKKFSRLHLKKIRNKKNKHWSNKSVILGKRKLVGRYSDAGDMKVTRFRLKVLMDLLQFHGLEMTTKVGWLLVRGLYNNEETRSIVFKDNTTKRRDLSLLKGIYNKR